jgi:hypothetical protein
MYVLKDELNFTQNISTIIKHLKIPKYTVTYQLVHIVPSGDADISIVVFPDPGLTTAADAKAKNSGSLLK